VSSEAAHFLVGAALALPAIKSRELTAVLPAWTIPVSSGLLATIPDLDLAWKHVFGPTHSDILGHRGLFHSPSFLILFSGVLAVIVARRRSRRAFAWLWLLWAGCMITHPLLDSLTTGGTGVMLLLPFTRTRFYFPWRPLQTASRSESLLSRAWFLRRSEVTVCIAAAGIGIFGLLIRRRRLVPAPLSDNEDRFAEFEDIPPNQK
jgi:inner membrane protein